MSAKFDVSGQSRNILIGVTVKDAQGIPRPATAMIDTGSEGCLVHPKFAADHLVLRGREEKFVNDIPAYVYTGSIVFDDESAIEERDVEFSVCDESWFFGIVLDPNGQETNTNFHILIGMDILESYDFSFMLKGDTRTFRLSVPPT